MGSPESGSVRQGDVVAAGSVAPPRHVTQTGLLLEMYRRMRIVRALEDRLRALNEQGKTVGAIFFCTGQEAVGIGVSAALGPEDVLGPSFRGHACMIGRGVDLRAYLAEMWGKATGLVGGRSGGPLAIDPSLGIIGPSPVVGTNLPIMVGQALAKRIRGDDGIVVSVFGDGAANVGEVHEAINLASVWKLPIVFVCENNQYGLTVPFAKQSAVPDIAARAPAYGLPGEVVDGNDVEAVYAAAVAARHRALEEHQPSLLEMKTYRLLGFSTNDLGGYQPEDEIEQWRHRDPLPVARGRLIEQGALDEEGDRSLGAEVDGLVEDAIEYAMAQPDPNPEAYAAEVLR